tara:strand:+ start:3783 stop:5510 length:1728 start_codon:yes stop_codon:yes gene_type:complete
MNNKYANMIKGLTKEYGDINRNAEAKALVEKWERTGLLGKLGGRTKSTMARLLENEAIGLRKLNEDSSVGDIAGFNKIAFPLVRRVFAQLIANEIVSVQPMSLPSGLLFYLDFDYDRNNARNFAQGGSVYGDRNAVNNQGYDGIGGQKTTGGFYDLNSGYSQRKFELSTAVAGQIGAGSFTLSTKTSSIVGGSLSAVHFTLNAGASLQAPWALGLYLAASSGSDGGAGFRGLVGVTSSAAALQYLAPDLWEFGSNAATGYANSAANSGSWILAGPAQGSVTDTGSVATNVGDFEATPEIPEINISVSSVPVVAETRKLKAVWTPELAQDLNAYHALDAEVELTTILSEQIATEIDREILGDLLHGAFVQGGWSRKIGNYVNSDGTTQSLTGNSFNPGESNFTHDSSVAQAFYGTQQDWYQTLVETILGVSNEIHKRNLRGGANFIVTSPEVATIFEAINSFRPSVAGAADEVAYSLGMENVGTLNNRFSVYKDPYFPANKILLGYKGNSFLETGYVYAPYVPLVVTPTIFAPEDFTPRKGVMTRYGKQMVRPEFYGTVTVYDLSTPFSISERTNG